MSARRSGELKSCPECGARVRVIEHPMGVPGGKDREQAHCPACGALVAEMITDGYLRAELVEADGRDG